MKKVYKTITALLLVCIMVIPGSLSANAATVAIATNYQTLKTAIENGTDTIVIANDITLEDVININHDVTFNSLGATIYAAAGKRHFNVFQGDISDITVTFQNVILDGKKTSGGLFTYSTNATIKNVVIQNCYNSSYGGAIYSCGGLTLRNCKIDNNRGCYGAGVYADALSAYDCIFTNNVVNTSVGGGGICTTSTTSLSSCTFSGNTGFYGGAICFIPSSPTTMLLIELCTITNNYAQYGGGIYNTGYSFFYYTDIKNNAAGYATGGGIYNTSGATYGSFYGSIIDNSPNNIVTN